MAEERLEGRSRTVVSHRISVARRDQIAVSDRRTEDARVFAGFHFRNSDRTGSRLGRDVARFVAAERFRPVAGSGFSQQR